MWRTSDLRTVNCIWNFVEESLKSGGIFVNRLISGVRVQGAGTRFATFLNFRAILTHRSVSRFGAFEDNGEGGGGYLCSAALLEPEPAWRGAGGMPLGLLENSLRPLFRGRGRGRGWCNRCWSIIWL
jgi:hypothetical protein